MSAYCKFGNFCEIFIFPNNIKSQIYDAKISRLWHDLPISVNDRVISPFREDFIFMRYAKFRENEPLTKISKLPVLNLQVLFSQL